MSEILRVDQVTKTYGKKGEKQYQALKEISFAIEQGEFVALWVLLVQERQLY